MDKLSGLVLDHYDDVKGEILKSIFPTMAAVPEIIKEAHALTQAERCTLPLDVFALELVEGSVHLRKYACIDAGNTALSVEYFLKTAAKLPVEAQKVAAANLVTACGWYGIVPPVALEKLALELGPVPSLALSIVSPTASTLLNAVNTAKGTKKEWAKRKLEAKAHGAEVAPSLLDKNTLVPETPKMLPLL